MTAVQRLQVEQSELRQRINELLDKGAESLTDEERTELTTKTTRAQATETELRAAITVEGDPHHRDHHVNVDGLDSEQRERIELRSKAKLSSFLVSAAAAGACRCNGAEAELQAAAGVAGHSDWSCGILRSLPSSAQVPSTAPSPRRRAPWVSISIRSARHVFAQSIAARLGVDMPRVDEWHLRNRDHHHVGRSRSALAKRSGVAIDPAAGAITVSTATPKRISARLELVLEDIAAIGQDNFESILRENLAHALCRMRWTTR